ncbi:hypothetical protein ALC62_04612 [Cyphomyrmex costatus]|uniref:Transposable element P transposase-like RNase H domain-containing protein n=1 Tax=Cyphomyrmex costatus TaxID=456900 RepID=A0A151IK40_9HYME|nr:hypothetical protein ALC62_04612 [Cyphomyrmex costatus]
MDPKDLNIILAWDEMAIKPSLTYDVKNDKIIGYEDWGITRTRRFADHTIVFYIRSLSSGQKMPIGYGFCNSATSSIQLSKCVKEWLIYLQTCSFKPKATVCDQGGLSIAAINLLIQETRAQLNSKCVTRTHARTHTFINFINYNTYYCINIIY